MAKFNVGEDGHVVALLHPISGTSNGDIFSMANYSHCSIILTQGVAASACTVTIKRCDDYSASNSTAINFASYSEATSGGDTLGARASGSSLSITSGSNQIHVIEIDSDQLTASSSKIQLNVSSANSLISAIAILSGARYGSEESPTAIA